MLRLIGRVFVVGFGALLAAATSLFVIATLGLERLTRAAHQRVSGDTRPRAFGDDSPRAFGDDSARAFGDDDIAAAMDMMHIGAALLEVLVAMPGAILVPALAVMIVGEVARIRSPLFYIGGGGLVMASLPLLLRLGTRLAGPGAAMPTAGWQVLATAGFAGGLVYWLIAGRKA